LSVPETPPKLEPEISAATNASAISTRKPRKIGRPIFDWKKRRKKVSIAGETPAVKTGG
jgi:hypothetical protein